MRTLRRAAAICTWLVLTVSPPASSQTAPRFSAQGAIYLTPIGGSRIAVDSAGSAYLLESGQLDGARTVFGVFVTKLDPAGRAVVYRTFVPGGGEHGMTVDDSGSVYVVGTTVGLDGFPATKTFGPIGSSAAACIVKLDPAGNRVYAVVVGGSSVGTYSTAVAADRAGNAYVTGTTTAADFPTTPGALRSTHAGGSDAFAFKLDPFGTALLYSTYVGGTGDDDGYAIAADDEGNAFLAGVTRSSDFPSTAGSVGRSLRGRADAFAMKLNTAGRGILYSTYLGGSDSDTAQHLVVNASGEAYVTGYTNSFDFPTTPGAAQTQFGGSTSENPDAFVLKLAADGSSLRFSTYLGGDGWEVTVGIGVDAAGHTVIGGTTVSPGFPVTPGAIHNLPRGTWGYDGFVTSFDGEGQIVYSTFVGTDSNVAPSRIAVDRAGDAYVCGGTAASGFVLKFAPRPAIPLRAAASSSEAAALGPDAAVDGDPWTRWGSRFSDGEWIAVDLGRRMAIDRVLLSWETAYGEGYMLQVADEGADPMSESSWTTFYNTSAGNGDLDDLTGLSLTGRYLRLVGSHRATSWGYSLWEFAAFGSPVEQPNLRPIVSITAPADRTRFSGPATVSVTAVAADSDGTISRVAFFVDGTQLGADASAPYAFETAVTSGVYAIAAVAYDNLNTPSQPSIVSVIVDTTPVSYNLALGRPVFASSVESGSLSPEFAVDGLDTTRWSSAFEDPQWLYVDLGARFRIESVFLWWETAYAASFDLQVSDDTATWTTIFTTESGRGGPQYLTGVAGAGRYVRMLGRQRATEWGYSLWEFAVYGGPADPEERNIALGRPTVASSSESESLTPDRATDGSAASRWSSGFANREWIYVDLGALYDINRVVLHWETAYPLGYLVEVSNDAANWQSIDFVESDGGIDYRRYIVPYAARYVRIVGLVRATEWGISLWEIEVYGTPSAHTGNLAGAPGVLASSIEREDLPATAAVDRNVQTRWSSAFAEYQWLLVDLAAVLDVRRVVVRWETAYASAYEIQISDDGTTWQTAFGTGSGEGGVDDLSVRGSGRYVRVWCKARATPWGFSIYELEVYANR